MELAGTGVITSRLGFGCSRLVGANTPEESEGLLQAAFENGITHFDVARVYGSGDAEVRLGRFISSRRDQVTITSKFGLTPGRAARSSLIRQAARQMMRLSPALRVRLGQLGAKAASKGSFSPAAASSDLNASLTALNTDHLDLYLLHECGPADCQPDLLSFLHEAKREGKIREFGIGTSREASRTIVRADPAFARTIQVSHSALSPSVEEIRGLAHAGIVTHGALAQLSRLHRVLRSDECIGDTWSKQLGEDCNDIAVLGRLMFSYAVWTNRYGPVLFSSNHAEHISMAAHTAKTDSVDQDQMRLLVNLANELQLTPAWRKVPK
jgi:aryl-alcohol dehydrogenase-like predicted oxidoreductase